MPLTLCHIAYSHYKPLGSRGPPACILSVCVYTSTCVSVCGFNPTGFWKHFVHLLMLCVSALLPSAHAGVIFIYYLLWQQREWRGVGESVLSVLKCLTIRMKFSMWRTRGRPISLFISSLMERWEGPQRRAERRRWQKERRSLNPPVYWSGLLSVIARAWRRGDRWGSKGGGGSIVRWPPARDPPPPLVPRWAQSDETRRLPKWQGSPLKRGSV